jgi:diguanylate cyclase (GGDEF)-like protein
VLRIALLFVLLLVLSTGSASAAFPAGSVAGFGSVWPETVYLRDPGGHWTLDDVRRRGDQFQPATTLAPTGLGLFAPSTLWFRLTPRATENEPWYFELSAHVSRGDLFYVAPNGMIQHATFDGPLPFAIDPVASSGLIVRLPPGALRGGSIYVRVVTRLDRFGQFALRPESWVLAYNRPAEIGRLLAFVFTIGIMLALGFLNLILALSVRDRTFAWYAAAMIAFAAYELVVSGAVSRTMPMHGLLPYDPLIYLTYLAYLALVVGFSRALLHLPTADPALWKLVRVTYAAVFLSATVYVVCPNLLDSVHLLPWLDPIASGAFLVVMLASGVALWRRVGTPLARYYCIAFAGGIVGIVLDTSARNGLIPDSSWATIAAALSAAWEALFLSVALSQHIRGTTIRAEELQGERDELEAVALRDGLSGLWNRRAFEQQLESEWWRAARSHTSLAVVLIDIDRFKAYNDSHGHLLGDEVLARVASSIARVVRRTYDMVARFGGEEFVILLPGCTLADALAVAESARVAVRGEGILHQRSEHRVVTVSVGVAATIPELGKLPATLVDQADRALYEAKGEGRDRTAVGHATVAQA